MHPVCSWAISEANILTTGLAKLFPVTGLTTILQEHDMCVKCFSWLVQSSEQRWPILSRSSWKVGMWTWEMHLDNLYSGRWSSTLICYTVTLFVPGEKATDLCVQIIVELCGWLFLLRSGQLLEVAACVDEGHGGARMEALGRSSGGQFGQQLSD